MSHDLQKHSRLLRITVCFFAGVGAHVLLLQYWMFVSRHYRDKPGMPPIGMFYTMPGIAAYDVFHLQGVAGELLWALADGLIYGGILLVGYVLWNTVRALMASSPHTR